MKIKKLIIIIIFLFILTGCTAKVNIEISDNVVQEQIEIDDQTTPKSEFREFIPVYHNDEIIDTEPDIKEDGKEYYKKEIKDNKIYYSYSFRINKYNESKTMKNFFSSSSLVSSEATGLTELYTSSDGTYAFDMYPKLTRLEINIQTDLEVEESNADSVSGNTYTWVLTPNNKNKNIYIRMRNYIYYQKHSKKEINNNKEKNTDNQKDNKNGNSSSNDSYDDRTKANIKYNQEDDITEKKQKENNQLILAILFVIAFIFIIIIIGIISNKKNR